MFLFFSYLIVLVDVSFLGSVLFLYSRDVGALDTSSVVWLVISVVGHMYMLSDYYV